MVEKRIRAGGLNLEQYCGLVRILEDPLNFHKDLRGPLFKLITVEPDYKSARDFLSGKVTHDVVLVVEEEALSEKYRSRYERMLGGIEFALRNSTYDFVEVYPNLDELGLKIGAYNALKRARINTTSELVKLIEEEGVDGLKRLKGIGDLRSKEIMEALKIEC